MIDWRIENILERVRKIYTDGAISIVIDYWQYDPDGKIKKRYNLWIGEIGEDFNFKSIDEIEAWMYRKEILFKQF